MDLQNALVFLVSSIVPIQSEDAFNNKILANPVHAVRGLYAIQPENQFVPVLPVPEEIRTEIVWNRYHLKFYVIPDLVALTPIATFPTTKNDATVNLDLSAMLTADVDQNLKHRASPILADQARSALYQKADPCADVQMEWPETQPVLEVVPVTNV